jgi:hypothetical protein
MTFILIENPATSGHAVTVNEVYDGYSVFHHLKPGDNAKVATGCCESVVIRRLPEKASKASEQPATALPEAVGYAPRRRDFRLAFGR